MSLTVAGQQTELFPGLEGSQLLTNLQRGYSAEGDLDYGIARDTLFAEVWARNGRLEGQYSGFQIDLPTGVDPTEWAFDRGINTEHVYPQSRGAGSGNARADMHHLYPTRVNVNADRGSLPFADIPDSQTQAWYYLAGQRSNPPPTAERDLYSEGTSRNFEPRESMKGDVARAMFYFRTIYRSRTIDADPDYFASQVETLCRWDAEDPISDDERRRSTRIAQSQGNENPFILDCTLPERLGYCQSRSAACRTLDASEALGGLTPLVVYPNPTARSLTVKSDFDVLQLSNTAGQMVWTAHHRDGTVTYGLPVLPKGLYLLRARSSGAQQKIIIE